MRRSVRRIRIAHRYFPVTTLGFERGVGIWVAGCENDCQGCLAPELQNPRAGELMLVDDVVAWALECRGADGLMWSGGEPMMQAAAVDTIVQHLNEAGAHLPVLLYTGLTLGEIMATGTSAQRRLLRHIDVLIDGRYRQELGPAPRSYRDGTY